MNGSAWIQQLIPFGYCLIRKIHTKPLPPCCPAEYLSVAGCLCEAVIPDVDNILIAPLKFDPVKLGEKWNISPESAEALFQCNRDESALVNYAMLNYKSFALARSVQNTFFRGREDILLIGLGALDSELLGDPDILQVSPLAADGVFWGFDLYEIGDYVAEDEPRKKPDYSHMNTMGLSCSICCCDVDGKIPRTLGIALNRLGLYQNAADAVRAADWVNRQRLGEPVWYLPLALIQY